MDYIIKTMSRDEVKIAVSWAAKEGWNPGLQDVITYYLADPKGFFIGYLGDEPIACISAVKYHDSFGFIGFYIVKPEYRGKGYGIKIWNRALDYLGNRNIGLDGVMEQQDNYRKSGFQLAYSNIRYEGTGGISSFDNMGIIDLHTLPFEMVDLYDRPFFPERRSAFIKSWICQPGSYARGFMQDGRLSGYAVLRPCQIGYKVGPLYADNQQIADILFLGLKSKVKPSDLVFLDVPEVNSGAVSLAERFKMKAVFKTARMYTKETPELPLQRLFGVTSFEIG